MTSVKEISERLASQAPAVVAKLLPGGKAMNGREWVCGDVTGAPGESLKVTIFGTFSGQWRDWSTDDHGDLIDLWRITQDITQAEAIKQAKAWLGIVDPIQAKEPKIYAKPKASALIPLKPNGRSVQYLTGERKLSLAVVEALKIEADQKRQAIIFPSYSPGGELINRSFRTLGEDKKVWQEKDCAPSMFGWQALPQEAYTKRTILLSEGQIDCASWLQWGIPALSIPNGTGCAWIEYEWDNLAVFDTFYLAFDQDEAGRKITETVCERLGKHRCMIVALPKKDANECLMAGFTAEDAQSWIAGAKTPRVKKLVTAKEIAERLRAEARPKLEAFTLPFFAGNWPYSGFYFRPGEVTIWGGHSHAGKSTMLNFMKSVLLSNEIRTFEASYEMKIETSMFRLGKIFMGESINEDNAVSFAEQLGEHLVMADVVGSQTQDELFEMMWFAYRRYGCAHYVIDSLMRIQALEENYPAQGEFTNRLQDFVKQTDTHVHLVCHLAKAGKNTERPSMYDVKGSSLIVNGVDNILLVTRNPEKEKLRKSNKLTDEQDKTMHDCEVIVEKQRATGWLNTFRLRFNPYRYTYSKA